jgi:OPT family oligopeptide transporter
MNFQFVGTIVASSVNTVVAWWLLTTVPHICEKDQLPEGSPWTCPSDHVFFDASVIWGLVGPRRIFGPLGYYNALNWFFLVGLGGPVIVWLFARALPRHAGWISLINMPVILGAPAMMPPASALNYTAWCFVGTVFNFFVFRYRKGWWKRYNYVLSAAMDGGVAIMGVLIYFALTSQGNQLDWWGSRGEYCDLATCPTAKGVLVDGCPVL